MYLNKILLRRYKNLDKSFDFAKGINLILAPNGSGKTNILEAIYILANGSSYKSFPEVYLINQDESSFSKLTGTFHKTELEVIISRVEDGSQKVLKHDGVNVGVTKFTNVFSSVIFSPNTVNLLTLSPEIRRKDLDDYLQIIDKNFQKVSREYKQVVRSRNKLLAKVFAQKASVSELDFWNEKLIELGSYIIEKRLGAISRLNDYIAKVSSEIFEQELSDFKLVYQGKIIGDNIKSLFEEKITQNLEKEISAMRSLYGPHRDDVLFIAGNKDIKLMGSRGQQRLSTLIYQISKWKFIKQNFTNPSILLLDDVMSELDLRHRTNIEKFLISMSESNQFFITSSEPDEFSEEFKASSNVILWGY